MILLIDNYDSFTYNLYQYLSELGAEVEVVRKPSGQPTIVLHDRASRRAASLGIESLSVSLSHSRVFAVASVVGSHP